MENIDFVNFNIFTKLILIVFMILGKIEVIAVLFLTKKFIFKE